MSEASDIAPVLPKFHIYFLRGWGGDQATPNGITDYLLLAMCLRDNIGCPEGKLGQHYSR